MRREFLAAALVLLAGCTGSTSPLDLVVSPAQAGVPPGAVLQLVASAVPATWSVLEPSGGTVTPAGLYTAPACGSATVPGTFHVVASAGGQTAQATVTVSEAVLSVVVSPEVVSLAPGQSQQFVATVTSSCGTSTTTTTLSAPLRTKAR